MRCQTSSLDYKNYMYIYIYISIYKYRLFYKGCIPNDKIIECTQN